MMAYLISIQMIFLLLKSRFRQFLNNNALQMFFPRQPTKSTNLKRNSKPWKNKNAVLCKSCLPVRCV
jgi:hypothetical protein